MEEATRSAELVRKEIQSFRNRYTFVRNTDNCDVCEMTLMVRPFYMFPCRHRFHTDCLLKEMNPMLGEPFYHFFFFLMKAKYPYSKIFSASLKIL